MGEARGAGRGGVAVSLAMLLTVACHPDSAADRPPSPDEPPAVDINATPREELRDGGVLRWGIPELPTQWNPHHPNGNLKTVSRVLEGVLPTPFDMDAEGRPRPDPDYLVDHAVTTEPEQVVTLTLDPRARWSTGEPITWRDYAAMAHALSGEDAAYRTRAPAGYDRIADVEPGEDEFQVVITFEEPFAEYEALFRPLLPATYTEEPERFNTGYRGRIPVTAGPFAFEGVDRTAKTLTLVRDEDWWGEPAKLDRVIYRALSPEALDGAFLEGGVDAAAMPVDAAAYRRVMAAEDGRVRRAQGPDYRHITLNGQSPVLSDVDVRHAVFLGIDRETLAEAAFSGLDRPPRVLNNRFLMPGQSGYRDNSGRWGAYDPGRAAELLAGAGWRPTGTGEDATAVRRKDGEKLTLRFTIPQGHAPAKSEAELVQAMLAEIGIEVVIESVPGDELFSGYVIPGNFDLVAFVNNGSGHPVSTSMSQWSDATETDSGDREWRGNVARIGSERVDAAMMRALESHDERTTYDNINEADRRLWELGHTLPLYQRPEFVAVRDTVANLGAAGFRSLDHADIGFLARP